MILNDRAFAMAASMSGTRKPTAAPAGMVNQPLLTPTKDAVTTEAMTPTRYMTTRATEILSIFLVRTSSPSDLFDCDLNELQPNV